MTKSKLTTSTILTNNCSSRYGNKISRITPHYMCWYTDGETCARSFVPASRQASANYCIGKDGDICCNVLEENRAWTTGSAYNDRMAITIECANYTDTKNGHINGELPKKTWDSLVALCVDICTRYGFRLKYTGNDKGNLTKHCWYQSTDCPGPWFTNQFTRLASEVNAILDGKTPTPTPTPTPPSDFGGTYKCMVDTLNVRNAPTLKGSQVVAEYHKGDTVVLEDNYYLEDGYVWGTYIGQSSGKHRYVAVGRSTGKVEDDDFLVKI